MSPVGGSEGRRSRRTDGMVYVPRRGIGVDGLCRDKTRPPGKAPLGVEVVHRVHADGNAAKRRSQDSLKPFAPGQRRTGIVINDEPSSG